MTVLAVAFGAFVGTWIAYGMAHVARRAWKRWRDRKLPEALRRV